MENNVPTSHEHAHSTAVGHIHAVARQSDRFFTVAEVFRQLGDPNRVRIFWILCHMDACVLHLSAITGLSSPAVSYHLKPLHESGLICAKREGKEVYYRAADTEEARLLHRMTEETMEIVCPRREYHTENIPTATATVERIHEYCLEHLNERITVENLARQFLINPTTLQTAFRAQYGSSLVSHIHHHRMERAAALLRETGESVAAIATAVGYTSQSKFTANFKKAYGVSPMQYRKT